jgi:hypothetical protein
MPNRSCCRPGTRWAPWPGSQPTPRAGIEVDEAPSGVWRQPISCGRPSLQRRDQCLDPRESGISNDAARELESAPRLRDGPWCARFVRIVPAALRPGPFSRNFDSLFAAELPRKTKSLAMMPRHATGPRTGRRTALTVTPGHLSKRHCAPSPDRAARAADARGAAACALDARVAAACAVDARVAAVRGGCRRGCGVRRGCRRGCGVRGHVLDGASLPLPS